MLFGAQRVGFRFDPLRTRGLFNDAGAGGTAGAGAGAGAGGTGGGASGAGAGKTVEPFATFPDEATFMARMKREGKAQMEALAKEMGFESADAMKASAKAKAEADQAAKSDLEKANTAREKAEKEGKAALETANNRLINADIKVFATQAGFVDPNDAVALIDKSGISVDDKGNVSGAKEAVEALKKDKPHLTAKAGGGTVGGGSNPASGGGSGSKSMNDFIRRAAGR